MERQCQHCGKFVKGLKAHIQAKHPEDKTAFEPWVIGPDFLWRPKSQVEAIANRK
jgi:hypothetical protein